jgi:hypothetical protein
MRVEEKRACVSCGSENAPDATFCWRCLVPFGSLPPVPGQTAARPIGGLPQAPVAWGPPPQNPVETPRPSRLLRTVVSIVAALGGYLGVHYLMGSGLALPDSLAGSARLTDQQSQKFEKYTAEEGDRYGIDAEGGVYGSGAGPRFLVVLVDASAVETTDQLFDAFVAGFTQAGFVVDEARATSGTRGASGYRCVGATAGPGSAVACMWRNDDNVGIVVEFPGTLKGTRRLLWTVHDTVLG